MKPPPEYSAEELADLRAFPSELVRVQCLNYETGGELWQRKWGHVADIPFGPVLRMVEDAFREGGGALTPAETADLLTRIGAHSAGAIHENDADYFERLAVILRARKAGRALSELTTQELKLPPKLGRAKTTHDLSRVCPVALTVVAGRRLIGFCGPPGTAPDLRRITCAELEAEVRARGGTISGGRLSRWITEMGITRFMAEQPIARKSAK